MFKPIVRLFRTVIGHRPDLEKNPEEYHRVLEHRRKAEGSMDRVMAQIRVRRGRFF